MDGANSGAVNVSGPWQGDGARRITLRRVDGMEGIGLCFEYTLTLDSDDCALRADALLGRRCRVQIDLGARGGRCLEGIVGELAHVGYVQGGARYKLVLRPSLWLLSRNRECRVFERQSVPEILSDLFAQHGLCEVEFRLTDSYRSRALCVQYLESDLSFAQRLMREEGLYYYFENSVGRHVLVVTDALGTHGVAAGHDNLAFRGAAARANKDTAQIHRWTSRQQLMAAGVTVASPDTERRGSDLTYSRVDATSRARHPVEIFDYSGTQADFDEGARQSRLRLEELLTDYETYEGATDAVGLYPGARFALQGAPREIDNQRYLIVAQSFVLDCDSDANDGNSPRYYASVRAQVGSRAFRMQQLRKPARICGAQTARVVDADGCAQEQPTAVRVRFNWDRQARLARAGSCWAPVFQSVGHVPCASSDWPRAGDEVLVAFLDGDPDRPVVVGRASTLDAINASRDPLRGQPRVLKAHSAANLVFTCYRGSSHNPPAADGDIATAVASSAAAAIEF